MSDYLRNRSRNAHNVYKISSQSIDLALHSRSQLRFKRNIKKRKKKAKSWTVFNVWHQTCHDGRLMHDIYAHARFGYLDLMQGHSRSAKT